MELDTDRNANPEVNPHPPTEMMSASRFLRRRLFRWKVLAALFLFFALVILAVSTKLFPKFSGLEDQIAHITIEGVILETERIQKMLSEIRKAENVRGVVVEIDSPGGGATQAGIIYSELLRLSKDKPVVTSIRNVAASGGYLLALPAELIFSHEMSIVGSIGVYVEWVEIQSMLKWLGIRQMKIKSDEFKGEPDLVGPTSPIVIDALRDSIMDVNDWFREKVAIHRNMDSSKLNLVADGRVFSGRLGVENGLIDKIGNLEDAVEWLRLTHDIPSDTPVLEWNPLPDDKFENLIFSDLLAAGLQAIGFSPAPVNGQNHGIMMLNRFPDTSSTQ